MSTHHGAVGGLSLSASTPQQPVMLSGVGWGALEQGPMGHLPCIWKILGTDTLKLTPGVFLGGAEASELNS